MLVATLLGACASAGPKSPAGSSDKVTRQQISETNASSAYDVVVRLHPNWLSPPTATATGLQGRSSQVLVYVDGLRMGGPEALRTITASAVTSIEFLSPSRAAIVLRDTGSGVATSVIMVSTR